MCCWNRKALDIQLATEYRYITDKCQNNNNNNYPDLATADEQNRNAGNNHDDDDDNNDNDNNNPKPLPYQLIQSWLSRRNVEVCS